MNWGTAEDSILSSTVIDYYNRGASVSDAIIKAAKVIGTTVESCNGRWYDHLKKNFQEEIQFIKTGVRRINDYVGKWSVNDEKQLMQYVITYQIRDLTVADALLECSKLLGRSLSSCSSHWYNHIFKRNRLTILNKIAEGKIKMAETKATTVSRNWEVTEENIAIGIMLSTLKEGKTVQVAMDRIAKRLDKSITRVRTYWYAFLSAENTKKINEARGVAGVANWDVEKKYEAYKFILDQLADGKKITNILAVEAPTQFRSTPKEMHGLWYTHIRDNEEFKSRYTDEKNDDAIKNKPKNIVEAFADTFTKTEDDLIADIFIDAIKNRKEPLYAYSKAAQQIQRTVNEVEFRWKKTLQYQFVKEVQAARNEATKKSQPQVQVVENELAPHILLPVIEDSSNNEIVNQIEKAEFDINKVTDFMTNIQALVDENKSLKLELENLKLEKQAQKDKDTRIAELEEQNKKLSEIVEQTRKLLNF
ncbi:hypothetical protein D3C81_198650 [compost metagenome]